MITIVLHSSKTMRVPEKKGISKRIPVLHTEAEQLATFLKTLSVKQIEKVMALSPSMAEKTQQLIGGWNKNTQTLPALDIFRGDIYSGLQAQLLSPEDREYAHQHLYILSGLYGVLHALDEIQPYRLEMGYKFTGTNAQKVLKATNLYNFWGEKLALQFPTDSLIINLSAKEYTKAVFPYFRKNEALKNITIISPKFLTMSPKNGEPTFVTVHAKIARGAFARWLIQQRIEDPKKLKDFKELGYTYDASLSTPEEPVFVAKEFQGLGLSVRLT